MQSRGPVLSGLFTDNGLGLLAAYIERAGYKPVIFDYNNTETIRDVAQHGKEGFVKGAVDEIDQFVKQKELSIIGFKAYANGFRDTVSMISQLKHRNPKLKVVIGGPHVGWFGKHILNASTEADYAIIGEAEESLPMLIDSVYKGGTVQDIPNLIYRHGKDLVQNPRKFTKLDDLLHPIYNKEVYRDIESKIFVPVVENSRGCWWNKCSFCAYPLTNGLFRQRPVEQVVAELEHNKNTFGAAFSRLADPSPSPKALHKLVDNLGPEYRLSSFIRTAKGYDFEKLARNFITFFVGVESANHHALKNVLNKTNDPERYLADARKMLSDAERAGISMNVSMIIPSPGETDETMQESIDFILETQPHYFTCLPLGPIPGRPVSEKALEQGESGDLVLKDSHLSEGIFYEVDPLLPHDQWMDPLWYLRVNGELHPNAFEITKELIGQTMEAGIPPSSDEVVLMAYLMNNGLSDVKEENRRQVFDFMMKARASLAEGNFEETEKLKDTINANQGIRWP
ncbi:radical SAM protein [Candidatus Woesearchaeota archaeon]|nr:radical SAM protein [Candidatus Woesearchaeota archaeon]